MENNNGHQNKNFTIEMNKITEETKVSMKTRTITALVMAAVAIPCVILGNWFLVAIVSGLGVVAFYEILHATGKHYPWYVWVTTYIFGFAFVFWVFFQKSNASVSSIAHYDLENNMFYMSDIRVSTLGLASLIGLLFTYSIFDNEHFDMKDVFYVFSMTTFIGLALQAILFLRFAPEAIATDEFTYNSRYLSCLLVFYVEGGVCFNDIFAYLTGVLFGHHKMTPKISPKKTWEGFFGGVIFSAAITAAFAIVMDACFDLPVIKGILDVEHIYYIIILSLAIPILAVLGDLMFSLIKRAFSIKDYGNVFPGHGGVLDRFDSTMITAIIVAVLIALFYYNPIIGVIV